MALSKVHIKNDEVTHRDLSIRPFFQLDITEFATDFHLNQIFAVFYVWIWIIWRGLLPHFWVSAALIQHNSGLAGRRGSRTWPLYGYYGRWLQYRRQSYSWPTP